MRKIRKASWQAWHLDKALLSGLFILSCLGLLVLYSAGSQEILLLIRQLSRLGIAFLVMLLLAQISPRQYRLLSPWLFLAGVILLIWVLVAGEVGKGAQRWLNLYVFRFQPSELMKIAVPMMLSWYLKEQRLPPNKRTLSISFLIISVPTLLIMKQPDLGTALLIASSGMFVLILAGMGWKILIAMSVSVAGSAPILWHYLHDYQRERVLTFLSPERDPLGSGYHIIQSKIAVGSGGIFGKGWLSGTQSHLQFLPERSTDFIFAVLGEEFGLLGALVLLSAYLTVIARCLYISANAQDTYTRLLGGSITLTFFVYVFVNIGMVIGILPVVGLPLPLVSYGGTSMVTVLAGFGILMSIQTHRQLLSA